MVKEGSKIMKRSVHEEDIFIVHDVLQLMTEKTKTTWMQKKVLTLMVAAL